jgi:nudix-type nucleoside diphosphatase (YffH/AdpP family)
MFVCGPLAQAGVLTAVIGPSVPALSARLTGFVLRVCDPDPEPVLCPDPAGQVDGVMLTPAADDLPLLMHYARAVGMGPTDARVDTDEGACDCTVLARTGAAGKGAPWHASAPGLALAAATAVDIMAAHCQISADRMQARQMMMRVRADSRLRAQAHATPAQVRRAPGPVEVQRTAHPYAHFFAVEEFDLSFPRFDGSLSPVVNRAVFVSGDAVTVLPYDPVRDRVLLVEQFRAGPFARGDANPWSLEAIAGRIDPGEAPEACARREAVEEAGLTLGALHKVADYYPSPAAKSEYLYSFVALTDLPDGAAGVFGVEHEAEDIRGHLLGFDAAMDLVTSGEVQNAPLILSLLWLTRERPRLRG